MKLAVVPARTKKAAIRAALEAGEVLEFDAMPARFKIHPKVAKKLLTLIGREVKFRLVVSDAAGANAYIPGPGTFVRLGEAKWNKDARRAAKDLENLGLTPDGHLIGVRLQLKTPTGRLGRPRLLGEVSDVDYDSEHVAINFPIGQIWMVRAEAIDLASRLRRALAFQSTEWDLPEPVYAPVDRDV